jgi:hypothetical protein
MSLGIRPPTSTNQFLNIATNFASSEETVGATFSDGSAKGKQKAKATETSGSQDPKKKKKGCKGKQGWPDDNLIAAADRKNPKQAPASSGLFEEVLKKSCPYHRGPTKHTLEECTVLHRFYTCIMAKEDAEQPARTRTTTPRGKASPRLGTVS